MATGTHSEDESRIREGFICPICMEDLVTDDQLLLHFEEAHDTEEDKDVLQAFKGENHFFQTVSIYQLYLQPHSRSVNAVEKKELVMFDYRTYF